MTTYAVLPRWQANRVYGAASLQLAQAEIAALLPATTAEPTTIGGVDYLLVRADEPLTDLQRRILSNASLVHALFERHDADDALRPVPVERRAVTDDDVVTIQRYTGKTNEQFTHLLVHIALAAVRDGFERLLTDQPLRLLDPVCGRGTSLNHAILYGMDAVGIEQDRRDVEAYEHFILTWLKDKRMKHTTDRARARNGPSIRIAYNNNRARRVEIHRDDTANIAAHVAKRSIDVLVADLPYGVQHQGRAHDVLEAALPAWVETLKRGGAVALAWNVKTTPRARIVELLEQAGLEPVDHPHSFEHRVDRAITRDAVVATIPAASPRR